jgi:hypothetical protein
VNAPIGFYAIGVLGALLFYAAIIAFVASDPLHRKKPKTDRERINADQYKTKSGNGSVRSSVIEEQQPPSDRNEAYSPKQRDRFDHVVLFIGLATLIAGIIYTRRPFGSIPLRKTVWSKFSVPLSLKLISKSSEERRYFLKIFRALAKDISRKVPL